VSDLELENADALQQVRDSLAAVLADLDRLALPTIAVHVDLALARLNELIARTDATK
jgi:hypothetical protein